MQIGKVQKTNRQREIVPPTQLTEMYTFGDEKKKCRFQAEKHAEHHRCTHVLDLEEEKFEELTKGIR
jgi:hypothetical protein